MGREVRRVPPGWEHPEVTKLSQDSGIILAATDYQPLHDKDFETAAQEWLDELQRWLGGEGDRVRAKYPKMAALTPLAAFWEWHGAPPDPAYYRPRWPEGSATWYQVYETVSEGTPVTPAFATQDELIEHLVTKGTDWSAPTSREAAEAFVRDMQSVPSMIVSNGVVTRDIETAALFRKDV